MKAAPRIFARGAALRAAPRPCGGLYAGLGAPTPRRAPPPVRTCTHRPLSRRFSRTRALTARTVLHRMTDPMPHSPAFPPRHPSLVLPLTRRKVRPSHPLITPPQGSSVCTRHIHILRAHRYARARRTHPAVPARSPHAPCCLPSTLTPRPHRPYPHPAAPAPACTHRPLPRRRSSTVSPVPTAHTSSAPARLPAEVLKLQDFSFYQSISNFVVSLPNLSKRREGTTFP